ncbi:MAG: glycosyltransferase family protein, partial [Thermodesulfobacteriota bacterium]
TLRERGFEHLTFLPLATDSERFVSRNGSMSPDNDVAFVGNSMVYKVRSKLRDSVLTSRLKSMYREVGEHFGLSELHSVQNFLRMNKPDLWEEFAAVQDIEDRLRYETGITWEATRIYREKCIRQLLKFNPIIAGDDGWLETLSDADGWRRCSELNYYSQLPDFYPHNRINFNCTSAQMKGAVNQRVFDVPASGSFLLTDYRRQLKELFDLERETACFDCVEEIPDLVRYYLRHPGLREKIVHSARQRILSEHTYEIRLRKLIKKMREIYA